MIDDIKLKCEMFSSISKTNITVTNQENHETLIYSVFDTPNFINKNAEISINSLLKKHAPFNECQVIYYKNRIKLCFLVYILEKSESIKYTIRFGPFLDENLSLDEIKYYGHKMKLSVENILILQNFFSKIPFYESDEVRNIFSILTIVLKNETIDMQAIYESREDKIPKTNQYSDKFKQYDFVEENYKVENYILSLIENGNTKELNSVMKSTLTNFTGLKRQRFDPLRNAKNISITANSLATRAAIKGGLNPHLAHSISTKYAIAIENQINVKSINKVTQSLLMEFCESVSKYSLAGYSQLVKKAVMLIRKNISLPTTLEFLASQLSVSGEHLSRIFKKETGKNITEFINETKIIETLPLVKSKAYMISDIAYMFGYCNAAYYSTVFKKVMRQSPKEYQKNVS